MYQSKRAERMDRHQRRASAGKLNLISLMDIFTILVFFLLVNSADVQDMPSSKTVQMPESVAQQKPRETVVVLVTEEHILVQGEPVVRTPVVLASDAPMIAPLRRALQAQTARLLVAGADASDAAREVTIMGDKAIPFRLLKKVMSTCTEADYTHISLAVVQKLAEQAG